MKSAFTDYSAIYAETSNNQMLLNLERMHDGYPIYFFQLGQISAGFTFTETMGLGGNRTTSQAGAAASTNGLSSNFTAGETVTHNPIFTLAPLTGNTFANQMLTPIKPAVFDELFEEGWPADQLMRMLVERIEVDDKGTTILENDPMDADKVDYGRFLRACYMARECQQSGVLHLKVMEQFQSVSQNVTYAIDSPKASDIATAAKDGLVWRQRGDKTWELGRIAQLNVFQLDPSNTTTNLIESFKHKLPLGQSDSDDEINTSIDHFEALLTPSDASAENDQGQNDQANGKPVTAGFYVSDNTNTTNTVKVRFVMRSLIGVITAMATEQDAFAYNHLAEKLKDQVPDMELHPLLELLWRDDKLPPNPVVALDYQGRHYAIADPPAPAGQRPQTWNRDVFRLLIQLTFQVNTDPATIAAPPLVQIR